MPFIGSQKKACSEALNQYMEDHSLTLGKIGDAVKNAIINVLAEVGIIFNADCVSAMDDLHYVIAQERGRQNKKIDVELSESSQTLTEELTSWAQRYIEYLNQSSSDLRQRFAAQPLGIVRSLEQHKPVQAAVWCEDVDIKTCLKGIIVNAEDIVRPGTYILSPIDRDTFLQDYLAQILTNNKQGQFTLLVPLTTSVHWCLAIININIDQKKISTTLWDSMSHSQQSFIDMVRKSYEKIFDWECHENVEAADVQHNSWSCGDFATQKALIEKEKSDRVAFQAVQEASLRQTLTEKGVDDNDFTLKAIRDAGADPILLRQAFINQIIKNRPDLKLTTASLEAEKIMHAKRQHKNEHLTAAAPVIYNTSPPPPIGDEDLKLLSCVFKQQLDAYPKIIHASDGFFINNTAEEKSPNDSLDAVFDAIMQDYEVVGKKNLTAAEHMALRQALDQTCEALTLDALNRATAQIIRKRKLFANVHSAIAIQAGDIFDRAISKVNTVIKQNNNPNYAALAELMIAFEALQEKTIAEFIQGSFREKDVMTIADSTKNLADAVATHDPKAIAQQLRSFENTTAQYKKTSAWRSVLGGVTGAAIGVLIGAMVGVGAGPAAAIVALMIGGLKAILGASLVGSASLMAGVGLGLWRSRQLRQQEPFVQNIQEVCDIVPKLNR